MKNVIFSNWRDFIEVSEKDGKLFSNSIFSIYPSVNRMFVADDDMTITTHNGSESYDVKKGDVVFSFQVETGYIVSVLNDDKIKQFILDRKEEYEKEVAEKKSLKSKIGERCENDCCIGTL